MQLKECEKQIIELEQAVGKLNDDFVRKTNEAEVLKKELQQAETALACGQDLLAKLQGERVRWERESEKLEVEVQLSPKYAALTACYITYLSDNPENVRQSKV